MSFGGWGPQSNDSYEFHGGVGAPYETETRSRRTGKSSWALLNASIRFYGALLLAGTKSADAITTAVGLLYLPGIVEMNPLADAVFHHLGIITGLVVLTVATVTITIVIGEFIALETRRRGWYRLSISAQAAVYLIPVLLFGAVAIQNSLLISDLVTAYLGEALAAG